MTSAGPRPACFEQSGYSATTMSDIAEALGILPGSLYHHFASKEEIAVDLLSSYTRALTELGRPRPAAPSPPRPSRRACSGSWPGTWPRWPSGTRPRSG